MSRTPDSDVASFDATGASHRRADFVVLNVLAHCGRCEQDELEERIMHVVDALGTEGVASPIHFRRSSGSNGVFSREFLGALDRGIRMGRIREVDNGIYELTDRGAEFLEDEERLNQYGVSKDFRSELNTITKSIE